MTVFGVCWRRFMFGYRSVPPATNCPAGPAWAMIFTASAIVCGVTYSNLGNRIIWFNLRSGSLLLFHLQLRMSRKKAAAFHLVPTRFENGILINSSREVALVIFL